MRLSPLREAGPVERYGGKASQLAEALLAGLPVPDGFALDVEGTLAVAAGERLEALPEGRWAVRSSAVGEDSTEASFAGQHLTRLNVPSAEVARALREVHASAHAPSALAYRERMGVAGPPRMAVVIQRMVFARVAGVLFTRNPMTGADELVVEGAWGLGESVVAGLVTPDLFRLSPAGELLEARPGHKDLAVVHLEGGGTEERPVGPRLHAALCLDAPELARLHGLALQVARVAGAAQDLEWAFDEADALFLLQRRGITA
ncbi:MAG: PEP/pyruvate-binding domain-containing protein [Deltaproteobacteria bacterium]|nr:PEP/pyruvate-binding domain-containing protein [Deltaproteobacteria bacterium]